MANMHRDRDMGQSGEFALRDESSFTVSPTSLRKRVGGSKANVTEP